MLANKTIKYLALLALTTLAFLTPYAEAQSTNPGELRSLGGCLDVLGGVALNGNPVVLWECHGGANQEWRLEGDGALKRIVGLGDKCLVPGPVRPSGNQEVALGPCGGSQADEWTISGTFPDSFNLVHDNSGLCLDVLGSQTANGTPILLFECRGTLNQDWSFAPKSAPAELPALLLPFYRSDQGNGPTTLFAVRNDSSSPVTVRYDYYDEASALGDPIWSEIQELEARAVRTVNVRDVPQIQANRAHNLIRGYAGFTVIDPITQAPTAQQPLSGDYFLLDELNNFASGDALIDLSGGGTPALCNRWHHRYFRGGAFTGGTTFTFWANRGAPAGEPLVTGKVYDETGNLDREITFFTDFRSVQLTSFSFFLVPSAGVIEWIFAEGVVGHISSTHRARGLFSVGLPAICQD